jgi:peptidyl-tRNA hydrolase, PTH1 family
MSEPYLIVGLGNPGREYIRTRHNIGFRIADRLVELSNARFTRQQCDSFIATIARGEKRLILAKPQTFMNLSGRAVAGLARFYQIPTEQVLVCCDDIDLPFGVLRLRASGGSAGQRGMQSILDALSTKDVPRLRFGVGRPPGRMDAAGYVLQEFDADDEAGLAPLVDTAAQAALAFIDDGLNTAMNRYNGDSKE